MDELLDYTPNEHHKPIEITTYGRVFYRLEISLWAVALFSLPLSIYVVIFMFPIFLFFYLILGVFFPFYSGVVRYRSDKMVVLACMISTSLFFISLLIKFQSLVSALSVPLCIISILGNVLVTFYVLGRVFPKTSRLLLGVFENVDINAELDTTRYLGYLLIRAIPIIILTTLYLAKQLM